jgi:hypothetical protein
MDDFVADGYTSGDQYDECYNTGEYTDQDCWLCPYKDSCSGANIDFDE